MSPFTFFLQTNFEVFLYYNDDVDLPNNIEQ